MDTKLLAKEILNQIGGANNVSNLTHCATRLRINLYDASLAKMDKIKELDQVLGCVYQSGQLQIIIGPKVPEVYTALQQIIEESENEQIKENEEPTEGTEKTNLFNRGIEFVAGSFTPILPAIIGAGLLKGILALFLAIGWLKPESMEVVILSFISDSAFQFLPILLAYSAAKKLKANPYIAAVIAAVLLSPVYSDLVASGSALYFFGLPIRSVNYASSVIPILLVVFVQSYLEKNLNKHLPKTVAMFVTPTISILVNSLLALIVLGPIGAFFGDYLAWFIGFLNQTAPWLAPTIMGAFSPLIIMMGMHYSLFPVALQSIASFGADSFFTPAGLVANMAQSGAGFAVYLRSNNQAMKATAFSTSATALLGITEPVLYGVTLKLKTPLYAAIIGGACGGFYCGIMHVSATALASPGLLALPLFANSITNLVHACIAMIISFVVSLIMALVLIKKD